MSGFFTHMTYIMVVALFIAGLGLIWAYGASHNAKKRDPEMQAKQEKACETCSLASMCTRFGKEGAGCDVPTEKPTDIE